MPVAKTRLESLQIRKLLQCVRKKDYKQIEALADQGVPHILNYNEPGCGDTALTVAVHDDDSDLVKFLVGLGAHPDVVDLQGMSPIMKAADLGHLQCFQELLNQGANLNLTDFKGQSVLYYCIKQTEKHTILFSLLLETDIDVNISSKEGKTALYSACQNAKENEESIIQLLERGANTNVILMPTKRTALMEACLSNGVKIVKMMLARGADPHIVEEKTGTTALHEAAKSGSYEIVTTLAGYGVEFDVYDKKGNNPIHYASNGGASCLKFLAQRGCNPKIKNKEGDVARSIAKENGYKDCLKELRKAERAFGKTGKMNDPWALQLYDWCHERKEALLELFRKYDPDDTPTGLMTKEDFLDSLQNCGAPIDEEALKKLHPLHDKTRDGRIDYMDFLTGRKYVGKLYLISSGKKKKKGKKKGGKGRRKKKKKYLAICQMPWYEMKRPYDGGAPSMYVPFAPITNDPARFNEDQPPKHAYEDDSKWYMNIEDRNYVALNDAAKHNDLNTIRAALKKGYNVDTRDKYYKTPLMIACHQGNMNAAKLLMDYGANVNAADNFKWTPLHHACHTGQQDIVEFLLQNGANLDAPALNGATPLFRAIETSQVELVQLLISKGAKLRSENRKGQGPLDCAQAWAEPEVLQTVQSKVDALPRPKGEKGRGGGRGGKKGKKK